MSDTLKEAVDKRYQLEKELAKHLESIGADSMSSEVTHNNERYVIAVTRKENKCA